MSIPIELQDAVLGVISYQCNRHWHST